MKATNSILVEKRDDDGLNHSQGSNRYIRKYLRSLICNLNIIVRYFFIEKLILE